MEQAPLGSSGLAASRIGLGTWAIGGMAWGGTDEMDAVATLREAVERGVTLVDTAPVYGFGRSEEIVGRALREGGLRDRVVVATKVGLSWEGGRIVRDSSRARVRTEVEASLRRLGVDVIDLYQVHWPDARVPIEETADALKELLDEGKVRALGVSNFSPEQMERFARRAPLHASQPPLNLFERRALEDVLPWCAERGVATLAYGALCRGLLSGRMTPRTRFPEDDLRSWDPKFQPPWFERHLRAVARLEALSRERLGAGVLALAVRWLLEDPRVSVALWGARRPGQLEALDAALALRLDEGTRDDAVRIVVEEVGEGLGPEFLAPPP